MKKGITYSEETRKRVQKLRPIDDTFFRVIGKNKEVCQEILRTLLDDNEIVVLDTETQKTYVSLQREITIDCRCKLSSGEICNIEIQKGSNQDDLRRTRFHASVLTSHETMKGMKFHNIPTVRIIYITEYDALGNGRVFTKQRHCVEVEKNVWKPVNDGEYIYYANTACKDDSDKTELLQLFLRSDTFESDKFIALSNSVKRYKETEEGVGVMCKIIDDYANELAIKSVIQALVELNHTKENIIQYLIEKYSLTADDAGEKYDTYTEK